MISDGRHRDFHGMTRWVHVADRFSTVMRKRKIGLLAALVLVTCAPPVVPADPPYAVISEPSGPPPPPTADAVVLVVLDGVRWQEISSGVDPEMTGGRRRIGPERLTPNLHELATTSGASVASITASGPAFVSLPG